MNLTFEERTKFEQWIIQNVSEGVVPMDEGNGDALVFNLVHLLREDKQQYDYSEDQNIEIERWKWEKWEIEEADNLRRVDEIIAVGHSRHCACRQVWGDGECTCSKGGEG